MAAPQLDLDKLIDDPKTKVVVCCGSGGVGKTTTSAALAVRAAERGRTTVVLTIDPARRLAQSLGLDELDNFPKQVSVDGFEPSGQLWAMMLDMRRTFDDMIVAHSDPERAQELLNSPFYQTLATSFSGTQEYMAMEKLGHLVAEDEWDLIIVDTPPSRNALDFLDAPNRLSSALDGRMVRLLTGNAQGGRFGFRKAVTTGLAMGMKAVSQVIGGQLLTDASAFMQAFNSTAGGFKERATKTAELMRSPGTAYIVVAAPEPDALREASYFVERLSEEHMPLAGLVANRTHPVLADLPATRALSAAETVEASDGLTAAVLRLHADRVGMAQREERLLQRFTRAHPGVPVVGVPALPSDVHDLHGLRVIGERLSGAGA